MIGINISFVSASPLAETEWPDIERENCIHLADDAPPVRIAVFESGLTSGRPSIAMRVDLPNGKTVVVETSARLFCTAAAAILARYPDLLLKK